MTVGFLTGKFAPLHTGHIYFISKAATMVDKLYVVLSYDGKRFQDDPRLSLKNRLLWLKTTFKDLPHIKIVYVDETNCSPYPDGWHEWSMLVKRAIPHRIGDITKIFSSEPEYTEGFNKYWPEAEHVVVDAERKEVNISATEIRANPFKFWSYMPSIVRQHYVKKVCIIGTESCGKTTLTKYLSKIYQTSWVEEYGRKFCEQDMCMDESLLQYDDYALIAARRYEDELQATKTANKILFADTNAFITNFYCRLYEGSFHPMVDEYEALEKYDLTLVLASDVEWVADGLRINKERSKTDDLLAKMLSMSRSENLGKLMHISGTYSERLEKAIKIIDEEFFK
ncbi:nicotinamide-nucleotide adenylyltransferase [Aeromonas phage AhSzq-1]|uniref:Nicotinamide-nucleotide adenylyltransferase n=1 Tax=Aeromonas phage AhSzq-1 TaxID=2138298 RepID=A0A2R4ALQ8_9CAUD|nr:nicotinamide-nucleotide adenylyltransferase [Aeromonas phage AhSzq-1]AVR75990.1 nicotinamide-nucleotide adenylyltransferase [Aeromonas phage AhSzq-1]